jgi:hypothetical protein
MQNFQLWNRDARIANVSLNFNRTLPEPSMSDLIFDENIPIEPPDELVEALPKWEKYFKFQVEQLTESEGTVISFVPPKSYSFQAPLRYESYRFSMFELDKPLANAPPVVILTPDNGPVLARFPDFADGEVSDVFVIKVIRGAGASGHAVALVGSQMCMYAEDEEQCIKDLECAKFPDRCLGSPDPRKRIF